MSGQMKTLIDRMNAMYPKDYKFREVYLLTTAAEDGEFVCRRAEGGLTGWIDCKRLKATPSYKRRLRWEKAFECQIAQNKVL